MPQIERTIGNEGKERVKEWKRLEKYEWRRRAVVGAMVYLIDAKQYNLITEQVLSDRCTLLVRQLLL